MKKEATEIIQESIVALNVFLTPQLSGGNEMAAHILSAVC